ncbi:MAG: DUF5667 domain-containing protein [bacterium]
MLGRIIAVLLTIFTAFSVLTVSVLRAASVDNKFIETNYYLPYPGRILQDNSLWFAKALRDKIWLKLTVSPLRKMDLLLLLSDKRLAGSKILIEKNKASVALSALSKGEKYLEEASKFEQKSRKGGVDTKSFLPKLASAALKHRQVIEEMLLIAPEDVKPSIVKMEDYSKNVYKEARDAMNSLGMIAPKNPFDGD